MAVARKGPIEWKSRSWRKSKRPSRHSGRSRPARTCVLASALRGRLPLRGAVALVLGTAGCSNTCATTYSMQCPTRSCSVAEIAIFAGANQFGFTMNGPIVIPKIHDGRGASFFTFSYEGTRERVGRSYLFTIPTAQQRFGDFSDLVDRAGRPRTVYDPASHAAQRPPRSVASRSEIQSRIRSRPVP